MGAWARFWKWYEDKILGSIIIIAVIQFVQIPHMIWNADLYLQLGVVSRVHPAIDWLLYGVDLIEIVSIINVGMIMYSLLKTRRRGAAHAVASENTHGIAEGSRVERGSNIFVTGSGGGGVKQVIAVRADLGMGKGKIAAQVGHGCVMAAMRARESHREWFDEWSGSQAKIVVRVDGAGGLEEIKRAAAQRGIPWALVSDAGHTQLEPGTATCIAIGPAPDDMVDRVTGGLSLL